MNGCQCGAAYIGSERACLRLAIMENRSLLSEQFGHDVGEVQATRDFLDHLLEVFSRQFRRNFCRACPLQGRCGVKLCPSEIIW